MLQRQVKLELQIRDGGGADLPSVKNALLQRKFVSRSQYASHPGWYMHAGSSEHGRHPPQK